MPVSTLILFWRGLDECYYIIQIDSLVDLCQRLKYSADVRDVMSKYPA